MLISCNFVSKYILPAVQSQVEHCSYEHCVVLQMQA